MAIQLPAIDPPWDADPLNINMGLDMNMSMSYEEAAFMALPNSGMDFSLPEQPLEHFYPQEVISLGLDEALPPEEMMEDL